MRESKDKIKSRMMRNAAQMWGFQEPQAESSFDPLVSLLLGACAFELEKISAEINNSESRIIERMVSVLTPHPITSPYPAHAVACVKPYKKDAKVLSGDQFFTTIKVTDASGRKTEDKQIFFSPAGTFSLTDGSVRYLALNKIIYEIVDGQYKDIITEKFKAPLSSKSLYIGIELNEIQSEITLFFDIISEHLRNSFFPMLESCHWNIEGIPLETYKGIKNIDSHDSDICGLINRQHDNSSRISTQINSFYNRQFITVALKKRKECFDPGNMKIPDALKNSFDEKTLESFDGNIFWLELLFKNPLPGDLAENLNCFLNCFPVINRRLNEYTGSTREIINIIPLQTEDIFFDLKRVTNSNGNCYKINNFISQNDLTKGSALLRTEGVGRFDSRSAMEYLEYLLELMKEERAAFNVIDSDLIASNLRELNQTIARLGKKLEDVKIQTGDTTYLMLKPLEGDRQVFVEFWSTNCTLANNIRAGSILNVYHSDDIDYNSSRLMTNTAGGREKPNTESRINTYRRALQSGDRVVTAEDIKALCLEWYGDNLAGVEIEKGIEKGSGKSEGFIRTIDVFLIIKKGCNIDIPEQSRIQKELLVLLEQRSSNIFPFRVFFRN